MRVLPLPASHHEAVHENWWSFCCTSTFLVLGACCHSSSLLNSALLAPSAAVSASLMSVMIAQLCGVTDIHLLFTIAALMASTMLFGHQMEVSNGARLTTYSYSEDPSTPPSVAKGAITAAAAAVPAAFITENGGDPLSAPGGAVNQAMDWAPFWMGCWPFLAAELVTGCYFFQAVSNGSPPGFVW